MSVDRVDRVCGTGNCDKEAVGWIGKFGEHRTTGCPINTPPGIPIQVSYCAECEEETRRFLASL